MTKADSPWPQQLDLAQRLIDLQQARHHEHTVSFLTANTILVGAMALLLQAAQARQANADVIRDCGPPLMVCVLGVVGALMCGIWASVLLRVRAEAKLRWAQACHIEQHLLEMGEQGVFAQGEQYRNWVAD